MNERQPYEKYLAEKFEKLSIPDVEPNWQQMKSRLDKEMPRRGGYWKWITAITIIFLFLVTWYFVNDHGPDAISKVGVVNPEDPIKQTSSSRSSVQKNFQKEKIPSAILKDPTITKALSDSLKTENIDEKLPNTLGSGTSLPLDALENQSKTFDLDKRQTSNQKDRDKSIPVNSKYKIPAYESGVSIKKRTTEKSVVNGNTASTSLTLYAENYQDYLTGENPLKSASVYFKIMNFELDFFVSKLIGDSIGQHYSGLLTVDRSKDPPKSQKLSGKTKSKEISMGEDKHLAIGFSLPLGFPLGDQKPGAYNINAKPNLISDFIPVPHLQYHLNNKVYLQTEVQFMNPQYIQPVLLSQQKTQLQASNRVQYNSVYAKKLYYFNIPVALHYSPFQHFYLGTGLQFSSLVSGVALYEETNSVIGSGSNTVVSQRYNKFKRDSISDKIDNSEFRLMLDANYYWKQFTVGLRYNQALSNYVNFRLNNNAPLFQDKNKSLQFYLRYNLWEDHKKKGNMVINAK